MVKRILVGLGDQVHAESATRHAIELAQQHEAELTGIALFDPKGLGYTGPVPLGAGEFARELRETRLSETRNLVDHLLEEFEEACKTAGVRFRTIRSEGDPIECLKNMARYQDLVVAGRINLLEHGVIDDPPNAIITLVEAGVRPVLAVTDQYRSVRRVLIAYSGSIESAKTMRRFTQFRCWPEAELQVVTFNRPDPEGRELLHEAREYCQAHGLDTETNSVAESPLKLLLSYAEQWRADLIVMGNSQKRMLLRRLFGETMLQVVKNAQMPLFLGQ